MTKGSSKRKRCACSIQAIGQGAFDVGGTFILQSQCLLALSKRHVRLLCSGW